MSAQSAKFIVPELISLGKYFAPDSAKVTPVKIAPGTQYLEIMTGGRVRFATPDGLAEFGRGTIFWHVAGEYTICDTLPEAPYRCLAVVFSANPGEISRPPGGRITAWKQLEVLDDFSEEILNWFVQTSSPRHELSCYIWGMLQKQYHCPDQAEPEFAALPTALAQALKYWHQENLPPWDSAQLSAASGVSMVQLNRLFRRYLKQTPLHYYQELLITRARRLLLNNAHPIKAIAEACHFASVEVFYRNFRHVTGMTPGEYRRRYLPYPAKRAPLELELTRNPELDRDK